MSQDLEVDPTAKSSAVVLIPVEGGKTRELLPPSQDQGILRFTWNSLILVAKGYSLGLLLGVNLLGLSVIPMGPDATQLTLFPDDTSALTSAAARARIELNGPHRALLVQGDDEMGALASVFARLAEADVNVYASYAVADGRGKYGDILYVRPEHYDRAVAALQV